jgi:hypothetical protein
MPRASIFVPKVTFFLGGVFMGILLCSRRTAAGSDPAKARSDGQTLAELQQLVGSLEARLASQDSITADLLRQLEVRLEQLAAKVEEAPSSAEIVTAVERLLSRTVTSLDDRLSAQAQSIDLLKSTVSQTDSLLERVLESIDSLEVAGEPAVVISQPPEDNPQA